MPGSQAPSDGKDVAVVVGAPVVEGPFPTVKRHVDHIT